MFCGRYFDVTYLSCSISLFVYLQECGLMVSHVIHWVIICYQHYRIGCSDGPRFAQWEHLRGVLRTHLHHSLSIPLLSATTRCFAPMDFWVLIRAFPAPELDCETLTGHRGEAQHIFDRQICLLCRGCGQEGVWDTLPSIIPSAHHK